MSENEPSLREWVNARMNTFEGKRFLLSLAIQDLFAVFVAFPPFALILAIMRWLNRLLGGRDE